MPKVLLIEDDCNLAFMITDGLESHGFEVNHFTKAEDALSALKKHTPDILLLDVNLKGKMDGFELGRQIRRTSDVPVIYTTARTQMEDLKKGYTIGNVDYLKKPFGIGELVLRINELLSQRYNRIESCKWKNIGAYLFSETEQCLRIGKEQIHLQPNEARLLKILYDRYNQVVPKDTISELVWGEPDGRQKESSLHNTISSLREKLKEDKNIKIETIFKTGYKLRIAG